MRDSLRVCRIVDLSEQVPVIESFSDYKGSPLSSRSVYNSNTIWIQFECCSVHGKVSRFTVFKCMIEFETAMIDSGGTIATDRPKHLILYMYVKIDVQTNRPATCSMLCVCFFVLHITIFRYQQYAIRNT